MNERELLVDCLRRLNRTGVIYYLMGSIASNYWGIPRTVQHAQNFGTTDLPGESPTGLNSNT
jgi:hypothetical protein